MSDEAQGSIVEDEIEIGGGTMSLARLCEIDTKEISETRMFRFPKGFYLWQVSKEATLSLKDSNKVAGKQAVIDIPIECKDVLSGGEDLSRKIDPPKCLTQTFFQSWWLDPEDPEENIGRLKALASDIGYTGPTQLGQIISGMKSMFFVAPIKLAPNKADGDNPWSNLDLERVRAATQEEIGKIAA